MSDLTRRAALAGLAASSVLILPTAATLAAQLARASGLTGDRRLAEIARLLPIASDVQIKSTEAAEVCEWAARKRFPPRPAILTRFDRLLRDDLEKNYAGDELAAKCEAFDEHEAACNAVLDADPNYRTLQAKADADQEVLSGLYHEVSSVRADTVAGMLVKLRLVLEWGHMANLDAVWPSIDEAYADGLPDGDGICDDTLISLWADAERLAGERDCHPALASRYPWPAPPLP